jgi:SagB-type dehydrogenase family enzyme
VETILSSIDEQADTSLADVLRARRSCREFTTQPLTSQEVAQLCWAAQGITDHASGYRTAPSAGALYPLALLVVDESGVYEYCSGTHELNQCLRGDVRKALQAAALDQACVGNAPVCLAIAMDIALMAERYGRRAERYCLLEAGHAAQNVLLQATAMGLGAVPVGAFSDERVADVLELSSRLRAVYLLPVGHMLVR